MVIRPTQMSELSRINWEDFMHRMLSHLRELYPEFYYPREIEACRKFIEESVRKAGGYGLCDEYAVVRYLDYRVLLGTEFETDEENAWMLRILNDPDRVDMEKVSDIDRIQFGIGAA
jgi:hypothetical protein